MNKFTLLFFIYVFILSCSGHSESAKTEASSSSNNENISIKQKQSDSQGKPIELTKEKFLSKVMNYEKNQTKWVFEGDIPCLIDFYADWCAPCRMVSPILDELAKEYKGKIHIYKVNVDRERELASVFGVRSIPTFLYCPMEGNPQNIQSIRGSREQTKEIIRNSIETVLLKNQ